MSQVSDPVAASALLSCIGSKKFRFIDPSGCESNHSPKDRTDLEVEEAHAKETIGDDITAKRGCAKIVVVDATGQHQIKGWAKRRDKAVFHDAEAVLKSALAECRSLIMRCSVRVGGARAVPDTMYGQFTAVAQRCRQIAQETNAAPAVVKANAELRRSGKPPITMTFNIGLYPELSLSDPGDIERAERIQAAVSSAIAEVCLACRSGDRERIRYVLDQIGALGDSIANPTVGEDVRQLLQSAQATVEAITARGRAESAVIRANPETDRGRAAAARLLEAQAAEAKIKEETAKLAGTIFDVLDLSALIPQTGEIEAANHAVELEAPAPDTSPDALIAAEANAIAIAAPEKTADIEF